MTVRLIRIDQLYPQREAVFATDSPWVIGWGEEGMMTDRVTSIVTKRISEPFAMDGYDLGSIEHPLGEYDAFVDTLTGGEIELEIVSGPPLEYEHTRLFRDGQRVKIVRDDPEFNLEGYEWIIGREAEIYDYEFFDDDFDGANALVTLSVDGEPVLITEGCLEAVN